MNVFVLGMHRSGTSCLTALLAAAGGALPGPTLRNWDNPLGHHEAVDLVRLNEAVLATSGGHWLAPPPAVRWTPAQAAERDRLLDRAAPTLWKDPRTLLVWPFWQAAAAPLRWVGVVRHPLAVAHSLLAWRGMPVEAGLRLWQAHAERQAEIGGPALCFDASKSQFIQAVAGVATDLGLPGGDLAAAYRAELVHHAPAGPGADAALLAECEALYERLGGRLAPTAAPPFPWTQVHAALAALHAGDPQADDAARAALAAGEPAAVLAPLTPAWLKHDPAGLLALLPGDLPPALLHLLRGKALLALHRPAEAAEALAAACALPAPLYEARHLLPVALWDAGQPEAADAATAALLPEALYPFRLHARRAEWAWHCGNSESALAHLEQALATAPDHRQGRLLHRRAAWRRRQGDLTGAEADLRLAAELDPAYRPGAKNP